MLDVGQKKLLVLLLVVHAEHGAEPEVRVVAGSLEQRLHGGVDMCAVVEDFSQRGS